MPEICEILRGIYGKRSEPVIVYNTNGTVLWHNESAGKLSVCTDKMDICDGSGLIKLENGGSCHTAEICGVPCIIAEFPDSSPLLRLFSDPLIAEFTRNSEQLVRQAVTKISASCCMLNDITVESGKDDAAFYLNSITSGCFRILRCNLMNFLLAKAADEKAPEPVLIWAEVFFKEIVRQCSRVLGESCRASYNGKACRIIRADKDMLTFFILGLVRKLICRMGKNVFSLEFFAEADDNFIHLKVSELWETGQDNAEKTALNADPERADDEAYRIFAEKLGAEYDLSGNSLYISFRCAEGNVSGIDFEASKAGLGDRLFSPCSIMLNDLTDYLDFF